MNMNKHLRGTVFTISSAVIFGFNPLLARIVYANGGNSVSLAVYRMALGAIIGFVLHCLFEKGSIVPDRVTLRKAAICAAFFSVTPALLYTSYNYLDSGMATTIHFVYPVLVILGCAIFYHEPISPLKAVCMALCAAGIIFLYSPSGGVSLIGMAIAFTSGLTYATYTVYYAKSGLGSLGKFQLLFWMNLFGTVLMGIISIAGKTLVYDIRPLGWVTVVIFAVVTSGLGVIFYQLGTNYIGPQKAALFSTFEPLTSVLVGIIVYNEALTVRTVCGFTCILSAVILLAVGKDNKVSNT